MDATMDATLIHYFIFLLLSDFILYLNGFYSQDETRNDLIKPLRNAQDE